MGKNIGGLSPKDIHRLRGDYLQRPGEDEFDVLFRSSNATIGLFIFWAAFVRSGRWFSKRVRSVVRRPEPLLRLPPPLKALPPPADTAL